MPRTLVITNDFPPRHGGIETYVHAIVSRFPPEDVVVYASKSEGWEEYDRRQPYRVVRADTSMLLPTPRFTAQAVRLAKQCHAEAVWFGAAAPLGLMARHLREQVDISRIAATSHGHEVWWARSPAARQALRRIGRDVDTLTYLGQYTYDRIAPALREADRDKLVRLSPGVDPADFHPGADGAKARENYALGDAPVILCVSRLVERKGQDMLIRALPYVRDAVPGTRLVIAGQGPYEKTLRALAWSEAVDDAVVFTGGGLPDDALPGLYAAADVFAMPCRSRHAGLEVEGLGIVYLEAAASGLPVIVGDSGGAPDAVRDGETGYLVDGNNVEQIADRLIAVLSDKALAALMGRAGRAYVEEHWDWAQRYSTLSQALDPR